MPKGKDRLPTIIFLRAGQAVKLRVCVCVCVLFTLYAKEKWATYKWIQGICQQKKLTDSKLPPLYVMRYQKKQFPERNGNDIEIHLTNQQQVKLI